MDDTVLAAQVTVVDSVLDVGSHVFVRISYCLHFGRLILCLNGARMALLNY